MKKFRHGEGDFAQIIQSGQPGLDLQSPRCIRRLYFYVKSLDLWMVVPNSNKFKILCESTKRRQKTNYLHTEHSSAHSVFDFRLLGFLPCLHLPGTPGFAHHCCLFWIFLWAIYHTLISTLLSWACSPSSSHFLASNLRGQIGTIEGGGLWVMEGHIFIEKKSTYKYTHTVQTNVVQGSTLYWNRLLKMTSGKWKCYILRWIRQSYKEAVPCLLSSLRGSLGWNTAVLWFISGVH